MFSLGRIANFVHFDGRGTANHEVPRSTKRLGEAYFDAWHDICCTASCPSITGLSRECGGPRLRTARLGGCVAKGRAVSQGWRGCWCCSLADRTECGASRLPPARDAVLSFGSLLRRCRAGASPPARFFPPIRFQGPARATESQCRQGWRRGGILLHTLDVLWRRAARPPFLPRRLSASGWAAGCSPPAAA